MGKRAVFNWSGGKDSSLALYHTLRGAEFDVGALLTTVSARYERISMHGVRRELLYAQGKAIGLPIKEIRLPEMPSMSVYDDTMRGVLAGLRAEGITHSIFGDIFLEDLRTYREDRLAEAGLKAHFPLWKRDTTELLHEFVDLGFKTVIVCIRSDALDKEFAGRIVDRDFLKDLPKNVDPCGENGEFHTFVFDGPIFGNPVEYTLGEVVFKEYPAPKPTNSSSPTPKSDQRTAGFYYRDLLPLKTIA